MGKLLPRALDPGPLHIVGVWWAYHNIPFSRTRGPHWFVLSAFSLSPHALPQSGVEAAEVKATPDAKTLGAWTRRSHALKELSRPIERGVHLASSYFLFPFYPAHPDR